MLFHFLNILVIWVVRGGGGKGQKMAQNDKKKKSHFVSPRVISHFFKILIFGVFQSSSVNAKRKF